MIIYKEELKKKEEVDRLKRENYVIMKVDENLIDHINELKAGGEMPTSLIQCTLCKELKVQVGVLESKVDQLSSQIEHLASLIKREADTQVAKIERPTQ